MTLRRALPALFVLWASAAPAWAQQATAPPDVDALLARAAELHQAGDLMGAIDAYKTVLAGQPDRADVRSNLGAAYARLSPDVMAALGIAVPALGSAVLGLALQAGVIDAASAFAAAHVDELFQAEQWGDDDAALTRRRYVLHDLALAERYLCLVT